MGPGRTDRAEHRLEIERGEAGVLELEVPDPRVHVAVPREDEVELGGTSRAGHGPHAQGDIGDARGDGGARRWPRDGARPRIEALGVAIELGMEDDVGFGGEHPE